MSIRQPTNGEVRRALQGSIAKWRSIVFEGGYDEGPSDCPLCAMFLRDREPSCKGCPVSVVTEESACVGSPYAEWAKHWVLNGPTDVRGARVFDLMSEAHAKAELKFLMGLDKSFFK